MKKSKNNNIILGFGYWVFEFGFSWCKGKVNSKQKRVSTNKKYFLFRSPTIALLQFKTISNSLRIALINTNVYEIEEWQECNDCKYLILNKSSHLCTSAAFYLVLSLSKKTDSKSIYLLWWLIFQNIFWKVLKWYSFTKSFVTVGKKLF